MGDYIISPMWWGSSWSSTSIVEDEEESVGDDGAGRLASSKDRESKDEVSIREIEEKKLDDSCREREEMCS